MKHSKRFSALLLALVMALALSVPAMAAQEGTLTGGSITIDNAVVGQTYSIYQLLYLESYDATNGTYAYKANSAWEAWLKTQTTYVSIDAQGYVTWVDGADAAAFAMLAQEHAAETAEITSDATPVTATTTTVEFTGLKLGYYLVDSTLGALCSLDTTNPAATIKEKNSKPTLEKQVKEDSNNSWGDENDADIGQTVEFKATITVQGTAKGYVMHDKMDDGLTYDKVTKVTLNGNDVAAINYTVSDNVTHGAGDDTVTHTFDVTFSEAFCNTLKTGDVIVVYYQATLNSNAVVNAPELNKAHLSYKDESGNDFTTPDDSTKTYTWDMDVLKYANGNKSNVLAGVKFVLLNKDKTMVAKVAGGKITEWVASGVTKDEQDVYTYPATWPDGTELTTNANGKIEIDGLDADTYYLHETATLPGYNVLNRDVEVVIEGKKVVEGQETYETVTIEVENKSGTELPSTGGMGTTVLYVLGAALVLCAGVLLITRRRMSR